MIKHFFLTRFNILLWREDKEGNKVRTTKWLEHRFQLFERFCLPSIKNQTCQEFGWIVLFDRTTPERYKTKIEKYKKECPQLIPVYVRPDGGQYFAQIFRDQVVERLRTNLNIDFNDNHNHNNSVRVLTTYLDNDDALNVRFVEDLQKRALTAKDGTFFYYDNGYQHYTEGNYLMQISYPRNHFVSVVEGSNLSEVKGIFGYGRHYYLDRIEGATIEHIKTDPMWCEVVHKKNMLNDANFLIGTKMVKDCDLLRREFAIDETIKTEIVIYVLRFLPRYCRTFVKRAKNKLFGRKW